MEVEDTDFWFWNIRRRDHSRHQMFWNVCPHKYRQPQTSLSRDIHTAGGCNTRRRKRWCVLRGYLLFALFTWPVYSQLTKPYLHFIFYILLIVQEFWRPIPVFKLSFNLVSWILSWTDVIVQRKYVKSNFKRLFT